MVSAMYMRAFEVDLASQTYLPGTRYMVTQMHVYAMTGWAWQSSCGVGCAIGALVSFLSLVLSSLTLYPLTS